MSPLSHCDSEFLEKKAFKIRHHIINTIIKNGEGHVASALSCADILSVLYMKIMNINPKNPEWDERDKFILSAGHKCLALYGALVERGFVEEEVLNTYNKLGSPIPGHPDMKKLKGVEFSTGSLGHGLSIGCGMALAAKLDKKNYKVYVLMGDGEQGEGSVWEAAAYASHNKLDNLVAIIDRNGLQINGTTKEILNTAPLEEKYSAFGWSVKVIDGHSIQEIYDTLVSVPFDQGKPNMIIANTIKGKGLSFAENNRLYHHWHPDKEEVEKAIAELNEYERRWL
ncbi:transketolase [Petroclostridium xylanilyticum]|jgi:transketolase|uniref:transketolase n=1 Tax=Petroclostridium xylanilyticum TaxID=1792311 RepID=UPI000B99A1ED|nr:transketolase [Petroclostridium xylanilyticum]